MKLKKLSFTVPAAIMLLTIATSSAYAQAQLTDGQILQVVRTLNNGEIKQAKEAIDESKSAEVKQVAQMIITDHEASNDQIDELLSGALDLDDSPLKETLEAKAEETHERLQDLSDAQYNCGYLQAQVAQHEEAISTAKTQLVPNAKNAGVVQFLTAMGPKLEHHLEMAQASLDKMGSCG